MERELANRYDNLARVLKGGLVVISAHDKMQLSGDLEAPFLQDSNFYWLTKIDLPGWKLILDLGERKTVLVRPERDEVELIFDGEYDESVITKRMEGVEVINLSDFETCLRDKARSHSVVYTPVYKQKYNFMLNPASFDLQKTLSRIFASTIDCSLELSKLRAIKSDQEISSIKKAINITQSAFRAVKDNLDDFKYEYEIEAEITRQIRQKGSAHGYQPIVASGKNAVTLHYIRNDSRLHKNHPVLMDVGARVDGYSADISRVYCSSPTKRQSVVYGRLKQAQSEVIQLLRPGLAVREYVDLSDAIMKQALIDLKLIKDANQNELYRKYFPHAISHGLGLDLHDSLGAPVCFEEGMVLTVEPGIYIAEEGAGYRIEDDILITASGHSNLSSGISTEL